MIRVLSQKGKERQTLIAVRIMKNAVITGGTRGIGLACAKLFSQNGYRVTVLYRSSDDIAKILSCEYGIYTEKCDVSDPGQVRRTFENIGRSVGKTDVLVNNAGISYFGLLSEMTDQEWKKLIDTNLSSCFYTCRAVIPGMVSDKNGRIINIGSVWGKLGASCEAAYSATKAGISGLTMALAKELGPSGITVNCVLPGVIDTAMNSNLKESELKELAESTPLMRLGKPEEVAETVLFLASEKASFITGELIGVGGGFPC